MPDLPGLIVGGGSLIVLVLMFIHCDDFSDGNIEHMDPRPRSRKTNCSRPFWPRSTPRSEP